MVAVKKTKKTHGSINTMLALVMRSGKYTQGYKTTVTPKKMAIVFCTKNLTGKKLDIMTTE